MVFNEFYSHFIDEEKEAVGGQMGTLGYKLGELVQQGRGTAQSQQILSPPRLSGPGLLDLVVLGYRALANTHVHTHTHTHLPGQMVPTKIPPNICYIVPESTLTDSLTPRDIGK